MMVDLRLREARNNSGLRPPDDATRSVTDKAASRLSGAKKAVEMYRKQLDDRQAALEMSRMSTLHLLILPPGLSWIYTSFRLFRGRAGEATNTIGC